MSGNTENSQTNFLLTKQQILSLAQNLSYQEKIKLVFSIIPKGDFHNAKYREEITRMALGLPSKLSQSRHGEDLPGLSLKTANARAGCKSKKTGKYSITGSQILMELGRIDKDTTFDTKDTIVDIWGDDEPILRIKIFYDENFQKMYNNLQMKKREKMQNFKQTRDSATITFKDVIDNNLKYDILYKSPLAVLKLNYVDGCPN
jgi:hypothetical protein